MKTITRLFWLDNEYQTVQMIQERAQRISIQVLGLVDSVGKFQLHIICFILSEVQQCGSLISTNLIAMDFIIFFIFLISISQWLSIDVAKGFWRTCSVFFNAFRLFIVSSCVTFGVVYSWSSIRITWSTKCWLLTVRIRRIAGLLWMFLKKLRVCLTL